LALSPMGTTMSLLSGRPLVDVLRDPLGSPMVSLKH
jgi:hypothetical protein